MSKVAIVFWSATGNTETMANCIAEGAGANGTIVPCSARKGSSATKPPMMTCRLPAVSWAQIWLLGKTHV